MLVQYINRKNEIHYIKAVPTKNGKERYYIVKDTSKVLRSELLTEIPHGFEFYELPTDGKVVLRKHRQLIITDEEMKIIHAEMQQHDDFRLYS